MKKKFTHLILIGRFQPAHNAHLEIIHEALNLSKEVIILIGSSYQPRTSKNPFTAEEREKLIRCAFSDEDNDRLIFSYVSDKLYNDQQWAIDIQGHVQDIIETTTDTNVGIIGHKKDNSSFYLDMFPQWELVEFNNVEDLHATSIRDYYFNQKWNEDGSEDVFTEMCKDFLNENIFNFLLEWRKTETYEYLSGEYSFYEQYKAGWDHAPYPPIFVTVDAVVVQSGHILLVRRRSYPGKGLWAIPGGFVGQDETLEDAMLRELREETKLKVPMPVLRGSIVCRETYDAPSRSLRGRTITHAFLIELNPGPLPKVKGGDDAAKAFWLPLNEIDPVKMFEDHADIIADMIGNL